MGRWLAFFGVDAQLAVAFFRYFKPAWRGGFLGFTRALGSKEMVVPTLLASVAAFGPFALAWPGPLLEHIVVLQARFNVSPINNRWPHSEI